MPPEGLSEPTGAQVDVSVLGLRDPDGDWQPLPDWARYHLEAGLAIGRVQTEGQRCVHAIVVPARDSAAALCASGVVLAAYEQESAASAERRFRELCALPKGSPVTLRDGRDRLKLLTGRLTGVKPGYDGARRLLIEIGDMDSAKGIRHQIPQGDVWRVGVADESETQPQKQKRARVLQAVSSFTEDVLFPLDARRFTAPGNLGCLIVGSRERVSEEAVREGFVTKAGSARTRPAPGSLDELMRLQKGGKASRTTVLPVRASKPPDFGGQPPPVTVFDGANGYLKWRDRLRSAHAVVVLDRTEPRFDEAVAQLQQDYVQRLPAPVPWTPPPAPGSVEALCFSLRRP